MTIFITIMTSLLITFISILVFFWTKLSENPIWILISVLIFLGFELVFFFLLFYFSKQKKDKKLEIENLRDN